MEHGEDYQINAWQRWKAPQKCPFVYIKIQSNQISIVKGGGVGLICMHLCLRL